MRRQPLPPAFISDRQTNKDPANQAACYTLVDIPTLMDIQDVMLSEQAESLSAQDLPAKSGVVNRKGNGGCAVGSEHQRVSKVDIQFRPQQAQAKAGQRMPI